MPYKDSRTELAPCRSHPGAHHWEGHSQKKPCYAKAGKHLAKSACSAVPELSVLRWHSLQNMVTQEEAKPLLNFQGAGISKDQPSPFRPDRRHRRPEAGGGLFISHHTGPSVPQL